MKMAFIGILIMGIMLSAGANEFHPEFSSPEATFATFVDAVLERDQDKAVSCFALDLKAELSEDWEEEELPDSVHFEVVDEYIEDDFAELEIRIWDDFVQEEIQETFYFVCEEDGWKMTWMEYDEPMYDYDSMGEDFEEW